MATEQDHVWAMLDDMLLFLSKRHVPTPERTYKLDGGWTLAMDDLRRFVDALTTERDQLRAEVERLRGEITDALNASGANAKAWQQAVCDEAVKRSQLLAEIGLTEQLRDAATARAEAAERERDEAIAKYEQLTQLCKATEERERCFMAHAADLRGALEKVLPKGLHLSVPDNRIIECRYQAGGWLHSFTVGVARKASQVLEATDGR